MILFLVCIYSEYLEVHQTELDKLTTQLKDMKRNSRLVCVIPQFRKIRCYLLIMQMKDNLFQVSKRQGRGIEKSWPFIQFCVLLIVSSHLRSCSEIQLVKYSWSKTL